MVASPTASAATTIRTCPPPLESHHFRAPPPKARLENYAAEHSPAHVTHLLPATCTTSFPSTVLVKRLLQKDPDCFATLGKTNESDLSRSYSKQRFSGFSHCSHSRRLLSTRKANLEISTLAPKSHLPCPQLDSSSLPPSTVHRNERTPLANSSLFLRGGRTCVAGNSEYTSLTRTPPTRQEKATARPSDVQLDRERCRLQGIPCRDSPANGS